MFGRKLDLTQLGPVGAPGAKVRPKTSLMWGTWLRTSHLQSDFFGNSGKSASFHRAALSRRIGPAAWAGRSLSCVFLCQLEPKLDPIGNVNFGLKLDRWTLREHSAT